MSQEQIGALIYEFESIAKRLDYLFHLTNGYSILFTQRGNAELEYSRHLQQQCGQPVKTKSILSKKDIPLETIEDTMKQALQTFNAETLKVAQRHHEMGVIFIEQVAKPLDNLQKSLEMNKKRIVQEYIQKDKQHKALIKNAEKTHDLYKKLCIDLRQVNAQLENAMKTQPQIVDRLVARKQQTVSRIQNAEKLYKATVEKANAFGEQLYGEPMKKIIENSVELVKTQFESLKNVLTIVSGQLMDLTPVQDEAFKKMKEEIENIDFEKDFAQFVQKTGNVHCAYVVAVELENVLDKKEDEEEKKEEQPTEEKKDDVVEEKKEEVVQEEKKEEPVVENENNEPEDPTD